MAGCCGNKKSVSCHSPCPFLCFRLPDSWGPWPCRCSSGEWKWVRRARPRCRRAKRRRVPFWPPPCTCPSPAKCQTSLKQSLSTALYSFCTYLKCRWNSGGCRRWCTPGPSRGAPVPGRSTGAPAGWRCGGTRPRRSCNVKLSPWAHRFGWLTASSARSRPCRRRAGSRWPSWASRCHSREGTSGGTWIRDWTRTGTAALGCNRRGWFRCTMRSWLTTPTAPYNRSQHNWNGLIDFLAAYKQFQLELYAALDSLMPGGGAYSECVQQRLFAVGAEGLLIVGAHWEALAGRRLCTLVNNVKKLTIFAWAPPINC